MNKVEIGRPFQVDKKVFVPTIENPQTGDLKFVELTDEMGEQITKDIMLRKITEDFTKEIGGWGLFDPKNKATLSCPDKDITVDLNNCHLFIHPEIIEDIIGEWREDSDSLLSELPKTEITYMYDTENMLILAFHDKELVNWVHVKPKVIKNLCKLGIKEN